MESHDDNKTQKQTEKRKLDDIEELPDDVSSVHITATATRSAEELQDIEKLRESLTEALSTDQLSNVNRQGQSKSDTELPKDSQNTRKPEKSGARGDTGNGPQFYIPPLENPYEKAWKFLSKHDILNLFQGLTANIVAKKPSSPLDYMIEEIEKLQEQDRVRKGVIMRTQPQTDQKA